MVFFGGFHMKKPKKESNEENFSNILRLEFVKIKAGIVNIIWTIFRLYYGL